jgi:hypothetical protein
MLQLEDADGVVARALSLKSSTRGASTRFVAIEDGSALRWLLPADLGVSARVLADWQPYKRTSQLAWQGIQFAARVGFLSHLPRTRALEIDLTSVDWEEFGWLRPYPPLLLVYVGTAGPQQKLVATLVNPRTGEAETIVKFPLSKVAERSLIYEYDILQRLASEGRNIAPKPMRRDAHGRFTVQSYIKGRPVGVQIGKAHITFLAGLIRSGKCIRLAHLRDDLRRKRKTLVTEMGAPQSALDAIDRLLSEGDWSGSFPSVRVHGDFAPWNLKQRPEGTIAAIDWEDSLEEGLPFMDLLHYQTRVTSLLRRKCLPPWEAYARELTSTKQLRRT